MVNDVAAEAGVDAADVSCEMTVATYGYEIILTLAIPVADGEVSVEVAEALIASIELLPEFEGISFALTSITEQWGERCRVHYGVKFR